MITLAHNNKSYEVKSISAAWNKIREIRDTTPVEELNGTVLKVDMAPIERPASDRLPLEILFQVNTKGKIEFKDLCKVRERARKKEEAKAKAEEATKEEEVEKLSIQVAEELNED